MYGQKKRLSLFAQTYAEYSDYQDPPQLENSYRLQIQPPVLSRRPRPNNLQSQPRFQAIQNNPTAVIDHRNNAWQSDHTIRPSNQREEDKVEEIQRTTFRPQGRRPSNQRVGNFSNLPDIHRQNNYVVENDAAQVQLFMNYNRSEDIQRSPANSHVPTQGYFDFRQDIPQS